jgi:error-prone DNA polymerase
MRPAGDKPKTLALWREAGEWWSGEPYREVCQYLDESGVKRETERHFPSLGYITSGQQPYVENNREEPSLRVKKLRDEKVARAMGYKEPVTSEGLFFNAYLHTSERRKDLRDAWGMRIGGSPAVRIHSSRQRHATYVPLHCFSGYAFGRSTMLAEEIPILCAQSGIGAAAIADPFSLTGCVEFVRMAKKVGVKPLVGASFELETGGEIVLIARSQNGYRNLSRLISECHLGEPRLFPLCTWERLTQHSQDLICLTGGSLGPLNRLLMGRKDEEAAERLGQLIAIYGREHVAIEVERSYLPWEISVNTRLLELAETVGCVAVAGGAITHARREHFPVQDAIVCAESLCTVDEIIGRKERRHPLQPSVERLPERALNGERFLHRPEEMASLFADRPDLLDNSRVIAERCDDDVLPSRTSLPQIFENEATALREITKRGMLLRHKHVHNRLNRRIEFELDRIIRLNFTGHFLAIWDACEWARSQRILFSGRGSVVDSAVAYCLGLSRIDAFKHNLHFDRFLPEDGSKRPDIDIDFEADRRDDVRQYFIRKYGKDHVATVAAVGAYCTRGIIREVGKALGLTPDVIGFLAKRIHGGVSPDQLESAMDKRPELRNSNVPRERFRWVFELAERMMDIPRNIRAHSSGVVISDRPLWETVPVMWSASAENNGGLWGYTETADHLRIIQWDKRSAKHYFDKFDILCLRGQDVLSGVQSNLDSPPSEHHPVQISSSPLKSPVDVQ